MYWKTDNKNTFAAKQVIDFATKNGWELVDSILFPSDTLGKWKTEHTFPFTYSDFSDTTMNMEAFPRWIMSEVEVYRFKTGWIAVEPGNARETDKNGYVTINSDGTELSVYHLWGEQFLTFNKDQSKIETIHLRGQRRTAYNIKIKEKTF